MSILGDVKSHINLNEKYRLANLTVPNSTTPSISQVTDMLNLSEGIIFGRQLLTAPMLGLDFKYESEDERAIEFLEEFHRPLAYSLHSNILKALFYGFSPIVKWCQYVDRKLIPVAYKSFNIKDINLKADADGNYIGFTNGQTEVQAGASVLAIWARDWDNVEDMYGRSILRPAYNHYYTQTIIALLYKRYFEQQGTPIFIVWYPIGVEDGTLTADEITDKNRAKAEEVGENVKSNSYLTMPFDPNAEPDKQPYRVEFLDSNMDGTHFDTYIRDLDRRMLFSLFISDSLIADEGQAGSFARSVQRHSLHKTLLEDIATFIEDNENRQVINQLLGWNGLGKAKLVFDPIEDEYIDLQHEILKATVSGKNVSETMKAFTDEYTIETVFKKELKDYLVVSKEPDATGKPEVEDETEKTVKAELEAKPQPKTYEQARGRFIPEAEKAIERAKKDFGAGKKAYRTAVARLIIASYRIGANRAYLQMDNAKGEDGELVKVKYRRVPINETWIANRARIVTNKAFDNLKNDNAFIKLGDRGNKEIRVEQNFDLYTAKLEIIAITEFEQASSQGFSVASLGYEGYK